MKHRAILIALLSLLLPVLGWGTPAPQAPSLAYGDLYRAVEMGGLFDDQKTFADAAPTDPRVMADYARDKTKPGFSLKSFVAHHFILPRTPAFTHHPSPDVRAYIRQMWTVLRRPPDKAVPNSSLLPLSRPYIVPGGRFREIYYWDSYFTMQGLIQDGQYALARDMLANIAGLISRY